MLILIALFFLPIPLLTQALAPPLAVNGASLLEPSRTSVVLLIPSPTPVLELRQNLPVGAAPATTLAPGQVSPVTTVWMATVINGVTTNVQVAYTQTFAFAPGQGPSPLAGSIGMGTLTGTVGAVKTQEASGGAGNFQRTIYRSLIAIGLAGLVGGAVLG